MILSILLDIISETPSDFILFLGRLHPLVVHLPIGILLLAALAEYASKWTRFEPIKALIHHIWGLGAIGALFAVVFGYFLSLSGDYNEEIVFWHKWSGVLVLILSILCYYLSKKQNKIPFNGNLILIIIIAITIFYTGHLGGKLTHGSNYLLEYAPNTIRQLAGMPQKIKPRKKVTVLDSADVYLDLIAPVMSNRCVSCHNNDKKKGDLDLTSYSELIKGGENGEVIIPGDINKSDFYRRITLSKDHDDFMPSEGKPPLTDNEIKLFAWWISNNAPSQGYFAEFKPDSEILANVKRQLGLDKSNILRKTVEAPKNEVIDSLCKQGFVINKLMKDNYFLEANFSLSNKEITSRTIESLFQIKEQLIWLNFNGAEISDKHLEQIGQFDNLIKLNLSNTKISDNGLIHLEKLKNLESLNLYNTKVSNGILKTVPKLAQLKRIYLSKSDVTNKNIAQLKNLNNSLEIIFD